MKVFVTLGDGLKASDVNVAVVTARTRIDKIQRK